MNFHLSRRSGSPSHRRLCGTQRRQARYFDVNYGSVAGSAEDLRLLAKLERPCTLTLLESEFDDEVLAELAPCEHLTDLILDFSPATDAAVPHLAQLKNLTTLALNGTQLTEEGIAQLRAALPACVIHG